MNIRLIQGAILLATLPITGAVLAQDAVTSPAQTPDYSATGNVAVVSDYVFRGIKQTWGHPAIQGGGDLTMKNGFAAGFWASRISERSYPGGAMELDLYG